MQSYNQQRLIISIVAAIGVLVVGLITFENEPNVGIFTALLTLVILIPKILWKFTVLIPKILWKFTLDRIRELSNAIRGK